MRVVCGLQGERIITVFTQLDHVSVLVALDGRVTEGAYANEECACIDGNSFGCDTTQI